MIPTEADRQRALREEALIKRLTDIAQKRAAQNIKLRQWALEYVARNNPDNAAHAVQEAETLLSFLAAETGDVE